MSEMGIGIYDKNSLSALGGFYRYMKKKGLNVVENLDSLSNIPKELDIIIVALPSQLDNREMRNFLFDLRISVESYNDKRFLVFYPPFDTLNNTHRLGNYPNLEYIICRIRNDKDAEQLLTKLKIK